MTDLNVSLSDEQKKFFEENGYLGPFTLFTPEEMQDLWAELRAELKDKTNAPFPDNSTNYDRHLDLKKLSDIVSGEKVTTILRGILGEDLLCWRSEWFPKYPGDLGTAWHQEQKFVEFEGGPKLVPTHKTEDPWEITAWFAFSDATKENGCMKVLPGTHRDSWYFDESKRVDYRPDINRKNDKKTGFFGYDLNEQKNSEEWEPDEGKAKHLEMKAGQFFIFTSRCLHASESNSTKTDTRFGWTARFVPTHVKVYPDRSSFTFIGEEFSLSKYSPMLVSGKNEFAFNKEVKPLGES